MKAGADLQINIFTKDLQNIIFPGTFSCAMLLTLIQQFPIIREAAYEPLRALIYGLFALLLLYILISKPYDIYPSMIGIFFLTFYIVCLEALVFHLLGLDFPLTEVRELFVPFGILLCSFWLIEKKFVNFLIPAYIILALAMGAANGLYYSGIQIAEQYLVPGKNQLGPILSLCGFVCLYFILKNQSRNQPYIWTKLFAFILFIGFTGALMIIRNRAGLLALFVSISLLLTRFLIRKLTLKKVIFIYCLLFSLPLCVLYGFFDLPFQLIKNTFTANYEITDLSSISAGRIPTYIKAIQHFSKSPIWGDLTLQDWKLGNPHNYVLIKLMEFGLLGSFHLLFLYFYLWFFMFSGIRKTNSLACWLLFMSLITSLLEYTHPYGPGTSQILVWFFLGQYLRNFNMRKNFGSS